jgi:hypothetical protein
MFTAIRPVSSFVPWQIVATPVSGSAAERSFKPALLAQANEVIE